MAALPPPDGAVDADAADAFCKECAQAKDDVTTLLAANPGLARTRDTRGFAPLQWAALADAPTIVAALLAAGADPAASDIGGQTPLHWAAVAGGVRSASALVAAGAGVDAADERGYTAAHVAAQHGQTSFLYRLAMQWGADVDRPDGMGRTPLHWAAYKGEADCVRLLLALGCDALALDAEVATPLHWAALRGQGEAATLLVHGGGAGALCAADGTGGTPEALARGKGHALLAERLARQRVETERRRTRARWAGGASPGGVNGGLAGLTLVVGDGVVVRPVAALAAATAAIARLHLLPISFIIILGLLVTFLTRVIAASGAPPPSAGSVTAAVATTALAALSLALALATATADPGVLPRAGDGGDGGKRAADEGDGRVAGWAGGRAGVGTTPGGGACPPPPHPLDTPALSSHADWGRLCVACRTVRPLRAKHCPVTGRCVARFDHYCPWMGCTVGAGNHATFLAFLASTLAAIVLAETTAVLRLAATVTAGSAAAPTDPAASDAAVWAALWMAVFVVVDAFALLALGTLAVVQARQVSTNLTTNEAVNWHRYPYLRAPGGGFHNPHDAGCYANWREVLRGGRGGSRSGSRGPLLGGGGGWGGV